MSIVKDGGDCVGARRGKYQGSDEGGREERKEGGDVVEEKEEGGHTP